MKQFRSRSGDWLNRDLMVAKSPDVLSLDRIQIVPEVIEPVEYTASPKQFEYRKSVIDLSILNNQSATCLLAIEKRQQCGSSTGNEDGKTRDRMSPFVEREHMDNASDSIDKRDEHEEVRREL